MPAVFSEKHLQRIVLSLVLIVFILALYYDSFLQAPPLTEGTVTTWEGPWTITEGDSVVAKDINLPYTLPKPVMGKLFTLHYQIDKNLSADQRTIAFESSMTSVTAFVDGEQIYAFQASGKGWARPVFGGSCIHFIRLKDEYLGKELTINFDYTSNNSFAGHLRPVVAGTKSDLLFYKLNEWPSLFYGLALLLLGTLILLFSLFIQTEDERKSFFYFGWVLLALGGWVFSQTPSKFILFRNPALWLNLSFAALYLLPFFLVKYIQYSYPIGAWLKPFSLGSILFAFLYVVGGILQVTGLLQYTDMLLISGLGLAIFLLMLLAMLVYEYARGNRELQSFLIAMGFLLFSILGEVILLILGIILNSAVILHFGMAAAAVVLFYRSASLMRLKTQMLFKEHLLLSLAYTDALTDVGNRAAYDREISKILDDPEPETHAIFMMDINDLKVINDTHGHKIGDEILKDFAKQLKHLLPARGQIFRYGGDEFVALVSRISQEEMEKINHKILTYFSSTNKLAYKVAVGCERYVPQRKDRFHQCVCRADEAMYKCKHHMKNN